MIKSYRNKEVIEACQWNGENQEELDEFVNENIEYSYYTNKPPVPFIKIGNEEKKINIGDYVTLYKDKIKVFNKNDFMEKYEEI